MSAESIIEALKSASIQIRDERRTGANTANRVGSLFLALCERLAEVLGLADKLKDLDDRYLRKDKADSTQFLIQFFAGLEAGLYAEGGIDGSKLHSDGLAELGRLQVNGNSEFRGNLSSKDFISGFMTGKGWAMQLKKFINSAGVEETKAVGELDDLIVRGTLRVFEFVVSQMLGENDNRVFTAMLEVDHYDPTTGKVWLDTQNGKLYNPFRVDDCIVVQQYNGMSSNDNGYYITKQYELVITGVGVGDMSLGEDRLDWVTFKNFTTTMEGGDVSLIAKGDTFVRWDNLSDPTRKGIIQMMTVGESTPYMDIAYGLKTDPDNAHKGRIGNLEGIYHHLFGWLQSFGAYLINLYAVGDFRMRQTGESLDTKIEMTRSLFQTRFQKLSYELTEEDNYLTNATFTENLEGWERENDIDFITMNDEALLLNRSIVTARRKVADIQEYDGQNMLCVSNSYIRQLNANIRKPGTHKEYTKVEGGKVSEEFEEVGDTLYLSLKFLCKKSGVLTVGFEGSSVSDDTLPYTTFNVASSVDWQIYKWSGKWDGTGDFVLKFTGDMFVSLLAITDNPLNDYKKEVSTSIEQTHSNIRLLGQNINTLEGTVTNLGIDLDAAEEQISIYAEKVNTLEGTVTNLGIRLDAAESNITIYANKVDTLEGTVTNLGIDLDAAEEQISIYAEKVNTLEGTVTNLGIRLDAAESNITIYANKVDTLEGTVTNLGIDLDAAEEQISIYAEKVDANTASISSLKVDVASISSTVTSVQGDLAEAEKVAAAASKAAHDRANEAYNEADSAWWKAYYAQVDAETAQSTADSAYSKAVSNATAIEQNATSISAIAGLFDEDGHLLEGSGWVTTTSYNSLYSIVTDLNGKVAAKAELSTSVQYDPSTGYVTSAIKLTADKISIEGITTINNSFSVDTDGTTRIAGFTVSGNGLINSGFDNDAYVIFRNDIHKTFAGIGGNVLPSSTGLRAVARFENHDNSDWWGLGLNCAMLVSSQGSDENIAIRLDGGSVTCLALKTRQIGHESVTSSTKPASVSYTLDRHVGSVYVSTQFNWRSSSSGSYASNTRDTHITLPVMQSYDDGHVLKIKRGPNDGSKVYLYPNLMKYKTYGFTYAYELGTVFHDISRHNLPSGVDLPFSIDLNGVSSCYVWLLNSSNEILASALRTSDGVFKMKAVLPLNGTGSSIPTKLQIQNSGCVVSCYYSGMAYKSRIEVWGQSVILCDNSTYVTPSSPLQISSQGDAMELVYHRDLTVTLDSVEYRGFWLQYKHPRSW